MTKKSMVLLINYFRGLDFRPSYKKVAVLQSLLEVPNLALTATATKPIQQDIYTTLGFQTENVVIVAALPNRY